MNEDDIAQQQAAYASPEGDNGETAEEQFKKRKREALEAV